MKLTAFFIEILPIVSFFIGYEVAGLFVAASVSVAVGAGLMGFAWIKEKRIALFPLYALGMAAVFTALALMMDAAIFIKIQPTVFNGGFGLVLLVGVLRGRAMMKAFFGAQFRLNEDVWMTLSMRWGIFFTIMAIANELAWRNLDDSGWVWVKTFVFAPASGLMMMAQIPITLKGRIKDGE